MQACLDETKVQFRMYFKSQAEGLPTIVNELLKLEQAVLPQFDYAIRVQIGNRNFNLLP